MSTVTRMLQYFGCITFVILRVHKSVYRVIVKVMSVLLFVIPIHEYFLLAILVAFIKMVIWINA